MTDLPLWAPGRPQVYRQVVIRSDGSGQDASIREESVDRLVEFTQPPGSAGVFLPDSYFGLKDKYLKPVQPGLIIEGHAGQSNFVFRSGGRNKFVWAENELLPAELQKLRTLALDKRAQGRTGTFIQVRLLDPASQAYLMGSSPAGLTPAIIEEFEPLQRALAAPFRFVDFKPEQMQALSARLALSTPPFTLKTASGEIISLAYYR